MNRQTRQSTICSVKFMNSNHAHIEYFGEFNINEKEKYSWV